MQTLIIHSEDKKIKAIKAFLKAFEVSFEEKKADISYSPEFVAKIKRGDEDVLNGNTTKITLDDIWKSN
jgi:hypothetical protein